MTDLMTPDQVAEYLQVSPSTVRHWMCQRRLPYCQLVGTVRILRSDLDAWVRANRVTSVSTERELSGESRNVEITKLMLSAAFGTALALAVYFGDNSGYSALLLHPGLVRRIRSNQSHNPCISLHLRQYRCSHRGTEPRHLHVAERRCTRRQSIVRHRVLPPVTPSHVGRRCYSGPATEDRGFALDISHAPHLDFPLPGCQSVLGSSVASRTSVQAAGLFAFMAGDARKLGPGPVRGRPVAAAPASVYRESINASTSGSSAPPPASHLRLMVHNIHPTHTEAAADFGELDDGLANHATRRPNG